MAKRKSDDSLLAQLREAHADVRAYKAGDKSRVTVRVVNVPDTVDVKMVRMKLNLSQNEFSKRYGFKPATVRDWEQGRRKPDRPARILLKVIEKEPEAVERVLAEV